MITIQPRQEVTLTQFTKEDPQRVKDRLKAYLYTGGDKTKFMRGILWMQIREEFEGEQFYETHDFQYDLEEIFETTCWTHWHFLLFKQLRMFFSRLKWTRFCKMAKELNRLEGMNQLGFATLARYVIVNLMEAKMAEDEEERTLYLMVAADALRALNWQERALLHQQLTKSLKVISQQI